jgi:hypothetical protein
VGSKSIAGDAGHNLVAVTFFRLLRYSSSSLVPRPRSRIKPLLEVRLEVRFSDAQPRDQQMNRSHDLRLISVKDSPPNPLDAKGCCSPQNKSVKINTAQNSSRRS